MLHDLHLALGLLASWVNILAIGGGMLCGVIVGAIPGLTGTMAVALALPLTFTMPPVTAILLLIGIYKGAFYGGSISAILIKTPGTPAAACTVLDALPPDRGGKKRARRCRWPSSPPARRTSSPTCRSSSSPKGIAGFALSFGAARVLRSRQPFP